MRVECALTLLISRWITSVTMPAFGSSDRKACSYQIGLALNVERRMRLLVCARSGGVSPHAPWIMGNEKEPGNPLLGAVPYAGSTANRNAGCAI